MVWIVIAAAALADPPYQLYKLGEPILTNDISTELPFAFLLGGDETAAQNSLFTPLHRYTPHQLLYLEWRNHQSPSPPLAICPPIYTENFDGSVPPSLPGWTPS